MNLHSHLDEMIQAVLPVVQRFHNQSALSPHAATIDKSGALAGQLLVSDGTAQLSVSQAIRDFETSLRLLAAGGEIQAAGIFYHSPGIDTASATFSLPPANTAADCNCLAAMLEHVTGQSVYLLVPYSGEPPSVEYGMGKLVQKPMNIFAAAQASNKSW